jgi:hypothetical protein
MQVLHNMAQVPTTKMVVLELKQRQVQILKQMPKEKNGMGFDNY